MPPAVSAADAFLYQTCAPMLVPSFRVESSCVQPPGWAAVMFVPPFHVTCAISRSPSFTLAGTARPMLAAVAAGPIVPAPTLYDAGSMTYGVASLLSSKPSSSDHLPALRPMSQCRPRGEMS